MKLKRLTPREWRILETLDTHGRLTTGIIAHTDYADEYHSDVSESIGRLRDYGLVEKVGPEELNSGLYETTLQGMAACEVRDKHEADTNEQPLEDLLNEWIRK